MSQFCSTKDEHDTCDAVMFWRLSLGNNFTAGVPRMVAMEIAASANLLLQAEGHGMIHCVHGDKRRTLRHFMSRK